jgi:hypothetical protein
VRTAVDRDLVRSRHTVRLTALRVRGSLVMAKHVLGVKRVGSIWPSRGLVFDDDGNVLNEPIDFGRK